MEYYTNEVEEYNKLAEKEYDNIIESRLRWRGNSLMRPESSSRRTSTASELYSLFLPRGVREVFGLELADFFCGTAIVEFKSISTKQSGEYLMSL